MNENEMIDNSIQTFLQTADISLIEAVRSVCRRRFPKTVEVLDSLSSPEWDVIRSGGLRSLSKLKLSAIEKAMKKDKFIWS